MAATKDDIREWFDRGVREGATHLIVVCDTYDWEDYPVYVAQGEDVRQRESAFQTNMQKVMEVYNLKLPRDKQLAETRAFNY